MTKYKHIFFDLDRTLWDFEKNTEETFRDLYESYGLASKIPHFQDFFSSYNEINHVLWQDYLDGKLKKEILRTLRFQMTLEKFGLNDPSLAEKMGMDYIQLSPLKTALFSDTIKTLEYLKPNYRMHIITNGFNEVQFVKIRNCGLEPFFTSVITSERAGYQKPRKEIFDIAIKGVNARKKDSIMVGDDFEIDILGAKEAGIDQIWFNPYGKKADIQPTFEVRTIRELQDIF